VTAVRFRQLFPLILGLPSLGCSARPTATTSRWCDLLPRQVYSTLERVAVADDWFQVYKVGDGVLAIYEPYQFQEVISYLIVGSDRALLFDTGMGMSRISAVVGELTDRPVVVLNSHTHYDHIGGNAEFDRVLGMDTDFTRTTAAGVSHDVVQGEVTPEAVCRPPPAGFDTASYQIRPFTVTEFISDGHRIELGGRTLTVLHIPGHTPDAVAVLDSASGYLWTGDSFYEAPIWLFFPETDLEAYSRSVGRLAALVPKLERLFAAHNIPVSEPERLLELRDAIAAVRSGRASGKEYPDGRVEFGFGPFSVLTSKAMLAKWRS